MRSTLIVSAFAALAFAAPRPQDIEFDQVDAAPDPVIFTPPVDGTSSSVAIQPSSAIAAVADASVTDTATPNDKRDFLGFLGKRDGNCAVQPQGTGPAVTT
jgi:hypothetical protein